jgi:AmmeMemoRadiSam system protein A
MSATLTADERRAVLSQARRAITDHLAGRPLTTPSAEGVFGRRSGVFVSLHCHHALRGCIGHPDGDSPLGAVLGQCAIAAATEDPRFPPVTADELPSLDIEISLLTPVEPVADPAHVEVGRHGVIIEQGSHRGLLLPQVATEHGWDRHALLSHACLKAGLPHDAWMRGASIFRFEANVFSESATR